MKSRSIEHQFEFWKHLGIVGRYIHQFDEYTMLLPQKGAWPSKIFNLQNPNVSELKFAISDSRIPNSVALDSKDSQNLDLIENGFCKISEVEGMSLKVSTQMAFEESSNIIEINSEKDIIRFAKIASDAFGYDIDSSSIISLLKDDKTKLFIGKYQGQYVSCGILFLDNKGDYGLHMIGANKGYRGLGLGKEMTQHLLFNATKNRSDYIHLVASKFGAPIYRELGFKNEGHLSSYKLK